MNTRFSLPLCRPAGHTCAACCWGEEVRRPILTTRLHRQTRRFRSWFSADRLPGRWQLVLYEVTVRGGLDLLWAVLLVLPGFGDWLRPRLRRGLSCAFLGFEDEEKRRVGCLLHPSRWHGVDVRSRAAFALLPGMGCGSRDYYCLAALRFARAPWEEQARFTRRTATLDWFAYSQVVANCKATA